MREILFRGKRIDKGEWITGDLWHRPYGRIGVTIVNFFEDTGTTGGLSVIPETVGQYIGRTDKDENKLFTDDIVKKYLYLYKNYFDHSTLAMVDHEIEFEGYAYGVIKFVPSKGYVMKKLYTEDSIEGGFHKEEGYMEITASRTERIGNIFDNPELLEVPNGKD